MSELAVGVVKVKERGRGCTGVAAGQGEGSRAPPLGGKAWLGSRGASGDSGTTREAKP